MDFQLKKPISRERLEAAARKIFNADMADLEVQETVSLFGPAPSGKKGLNQWPAVENFSTRIAADDTPDPRAAARALAIEGDVEVLWLDDSDDSVDLEEDFYGYTLGPYVLFKPDGSEHRARLPPVDIDAPSKGLWPILLD